ncbi:hypothetical protein TNCV_3804221 [Trichonephila clavipes]|nr:hypothetical protein TNCV_3804221 [Trichonephila clavipes]
MRRRRDAVLVALLQGSASGSPIGTKQTTHSPIMRCPILKLYEGYLSKGLLKLDRVKRTTPPLSKHTYFEPLPDLAASLSDETSLTAEFEPITLLIQRQL